MPKYVIIGNSAGAIGAVEAIRECDPAGSLMVISDESVLAYSRPAIAEVVAGSKTPDTITYRNESFYHKHSVETALGDEAASIDTAAHEVALASGRVVSYEKLLIATGGTPIRPPMEGSDKAGVYSFTTVADALAVKQRLDTVGKRAVVIGAGLIGAACSDALVRMGAEPTVIELRDRPLNLLLDEAGSELVRRAMAKAGVKLICNATVQKVTGRADDPGSVGGAVLADGREIPCDAVIVAVGVRPRMDLAVRAGITTNRGIVVDKSMRTSAPEVYACGDVAEAYDLIFGGNRVVPIWPGAHKGGRVAGRNMAGQPAELFDSISMNTIKYFGLTIASAGDISIENGDDIQVLKTVNLDRGHYRKIVLKNDRVIGFILAPMIERSGVLTWLLQEQIPVTPFKDKLVRDDFDLIHVTRELRQQRFLDSTGTDAAQARAWGTPIQFAAASRSNGGSNGVH